MFFEPSTLFPLLVNGSYAFLPSFLALLRVGSLRLAMSSVAQASLATSDSLWDRFLPHVFCTRRVLLSFDEGAPLLDFLCYSEHFSLGISLVSFFAAFWAAFTYLLRSTIPVKELLPLTESFSLFSLFTIRKLLRFCCFLRTLRVFTYPFLFEILLICLCILPVTVHWLRLNWFSSPFLFCFWFSRDLLREEKVYCM